MTQNMQHLKTEIIASLDILPQESLKLLAEFVAFLQQRAPESSPGEDDTQQTRPNQLEDPIWQLGAQPVVEDVTDASIHHDIYQEQ